MQRTIIIGTVFSILFCVAGCEPYQETDTHVIRPSEYEFMLVFALDTSPAFTEQMFAKDAPAYRFFVSSLEQYFRDRGVREDRVLLTCLSEDESPLLWQGTPRDLLREFNKPDALKQFLQQHSKPNKRVYASLANTLDYVTDLAPVRNGNAKACVVVLSNMMDNSAKRKEDQAKMAAALKRFTAVKSEIGFWWIDQRAVKDCQKCFRDAGLPEPQFEIMENNPTPLNFE